MRIGVIGAGTAGLTTAWLLNDHHDVTLFEKQNRLGGHAHTIEVEQGGERIGIDAGFEFFSDVMFPKFTRLLSTLGVALCKFPMTATLYTVDNRRVFMLPPVRDGKVIWSALRPQSLLAMLQHQRVLSSAVRLMDTPDPSITLEQFLNNLPVARSFKDDFLYPLLMAGWCVGLEDFKRFSAYNVLKYSFMHKSSGLSPYCWTEVVGGTQAYVKAVARALTRTDIKLSADISRITRPGNTHVVHNADGRAYAFDHLVIATNADEARALLAQLEGAEEIRQTLNQVEYFKTTIAVHGDRRLMPAQEKHWSVVNTRYDGRYSTNTIWKSWKSRKPIFRSWVTYETQMPEPLYALATYYHPKVNLSYFQAQHSLTRLQGKNHLWFVGTYTHDVDCHESAVVSAIKVVQQLDPQSARFKQLLVGR